MQGCASAVQTVYGLQEWWCHLHLRMQDTSVFLNNTGSGRPIPKFAQVVVLPTPPFWLTMAIICVFITSPRFWLLLLFLDEIAISLSRYSPNRYASIAARLITRVNRKSRHFKIIKWRFFLMPESFPWNSVWDTLRASHTDQRSSNDYSCKHDSHFPPRHDKKHPVIYYRVPALESYLIVQIMPNPSAKNPVSESAKIPIKNTPEIALWLSYFLTTKAVFWPHFCRLSYI